MQYPITLCLLLEETPVLKNKLLGLSAFLNFSKNLCSGSYSNQTPRITPHVSLLQGTITPEKHFPLIDKWVEENKALIPTYIQFDPHIDDTNPLVVNSGLKVHQMLV